MNKNSKKLKGSLLFGVLLSMSILTGCNEKESGGENKPEDHTHTYASVWSKDETGHWHAATCEHTTEKKDNSAHTMVADTSKTDIPSTETVKGKHFVKCSVCEYESFEELPLVDHVHTFSNDWSKDATNHWHAATCAHTSEKKDSAAHTMVADTSKTDTPSTETVHGKHFTKCSVCGYESYDELPLIDHTHTFADTWTSNETEHWHAATCEHASEKSNVGSHTFGDWETVTEATFDAEGTKKKTCSVCNYEVTESISQLTHSFSEDWTYDDNQHWHVCTDEGYTDLTTEKIDHDFSETLSETPASYFEAGSKTVKCACGKTKEVEIPQLVPEEVMTSLTTDTTVTCDSTTVTNKKGISKICDGMWVIATEDKDVQADSGSGNIFTKGKINPDSRMILINLGAKAQISFRVGASKQSSGVFLSMGIWNTTPNEAADNYMEGMKFDTKKGSNAASNNDYTVTLEPGLYAFGSTSGSVKTSTFTFEFHTPEEGNYGYDATNHWLQAEGCEKHYSEAAHTMSETWIERTPATLEAPGVEYRSCTVCDYEETREIPQLTEKEYATTWSADETQHWHECLEEGESGKANGKDVGDHTFVFGYDEDGTLANRCIVCGYADKEYTKSTFTSVCSQDTFLSSGSQSADNSGAELLRSYASTSNNFRPYLGFDLSSIIGSADYANVDEDSYFAFNFNMVGWSSSNNSIQNLTDERMPTKFTIKAMKVDELDNASDWSKTLNWKTATDQYAYGSATVIDNTFTYTGINIDGVRKAASFEVLMKVSDLTPFINEKGYLVLAVVSSTNDARIVSCENTNETYGNAPETMGLYY